MSNIVTVKVEYDLSKTNKILEKIKSGDLAKYMADKYRDTLKRKITERSYLPTGELTNSIVARESSKTTAEVVGADYVWFANNGRLPGKVPLNNPKIIAWAGRANMKADSLIKHIAQYGTQPKYFIESTTQYMLTNTPKYIKQNIKTGD